MTNTHLPFGQHPTFAAELLVARERLTLADTIGLALRAHRRQLGLSQRAYAVVRGWSRAMASRLEAGPQAMSLGTVEQALAPTGYGLALVDLTERDPDGVPAVVRPCHWDRAELLARVRGGSRRFPGHRRTEQVSSPPWWWWDRESTYALAVWPNWYCAQKPLPQVVAAAGAEPADQEQPDDQEPPADSPSAA